MGQFNISITAQGGHGCERKAKEGGELYGRCKRLDCPDCLAYDFVQELKLKGMNVESAIFTHWPGSPHEVVDDMNRSGGGVRTKGHF